MAEEPEKKDTEEESEEESKTKGPDHKAEADKWKAMSRKHEAEAKKNADAAKRLAELEEKDKTEIEKLKDAQTVAEKRAEEAELQVLRFEVAAEKGLSASQAKRLIGTTKDELMSDADDLLEAFKSDKDTKKAPPDGKPKPDLKGGNDSEKETDSEEDPLKLAARVPR